MEVIRSEHLHQTIAETICAMTVSAAVVEARHGKNMNDVGREALGADEAVDGGETRVFSRMYAVHGAQALTVTAPPTASDASPGPL